MVKVRHDKFVLAGRHQFMQQNDRVNAAADRHQILH
jgi:hypothetical protein